MNENARSGEDEMKKLGGMTAVFLIATAIVLLGVSQGASAQSVFNVPGDFSTIEQAIEASSDGDMILVSPGVYIENISFHGKAIHLKSTDGPEVTIIDGDRLDTVVTFNQGEGRESILEGFTIRNGEVNLDGGGIRVFQASPKILFNIIEENFACDGVGISSRFGSPLIQGNIIRHNERYGCSGGSGGAGIYLGGASSPEVIGNIIEHNDIDGAAGAGISMNAAGTPRIERNIIRYNTGAREGGGISMINRSDAEIIQNLIYGNDAGKGGGLYWMVPSGKRGPRLLNNTIADNDAGEGSAIYSRGFPGNIILENNLLLGKAGQDAVYCDTGYSSDLPTFRHNNAFSEGAEAYSADCGDPTGVNGNISADPLFVDAAGQDFHLLYGSLSIDSGDSSVGDLPATDLDGRSRILDGDGDESAIVDMGAYEAVTPATGDRVIGEVGQITDLTQTPQTVVLSRSYDAPVVFAQPLSYDGSDEALVRITNVESDTFTLFVDEAPNKDGSHTTETVSYIVLESGNWELEDGTLLEVSTLTTEAVVGKRISNVWETISFTSHFSENPVVLSQVQSYNDPGWVGTRQRNASANSFQMAMEAEESATVRHGAEVVGWIAIEPREGTWSGMLYEAGHTPDRVSHKWYSISFGQNFAQAPRFVAALAKYDGSDSSHLRYQSLTSASVQVKVEEDTAYDKEKNHTKEVVDYIAVAADGPLTIPGEVVQPTPVPSPTPKPTNTPTPTNTPEPTATATDTPLPTDTPTDTPDIPIPTGTGTPYSTSTPLPEPQCNLITIDQHYFSSTSYMYVIVRNSNPVDVYLTESYLDWPTHEGMYLDWLYYNGYYFLDENDYESPNRTVVEPSKVLPTYSTQYWFAGFAVRPDNWKDGHWTIELTFNGDCVVPYSFQYFEPTPVPTIGGTGTVTPTYTPGP